MPQVFLILTIVKNIEINLKKILSYNFRKNLRKLKNVFYKKNTVVNIANKLLNIDNIKLKNF